MLFTYFDLEMTEKNLARQILHSTLLRRYNTELKARTEIGQ